MTNNKPLRQQLIEHFSNQKFPEETANNLISAFDEYVKAGNSDDDALAQLRKNYFRPAQETKASVDYKRAIEIELQKNSCGLNAGQIKSIMEKFNATASKYGQERAFSIIHETYSNGSTDDARQIHEAYAASLDVRVESATSRVLRESLESINRDNTILQNPADRWKRTVSDITDNYARLMKGLQVSLRSQFTQGNELLCFDKSDYEQVMRTIPKLEIVKHSENVAFGNYKSNPISELEFE